MSKSRTYKIKIKGKLVPVTEDVYLAYYRMDRRARFLEEKDMAHGKVLYSNLDTRTLNGEETIPDMNAESVEDIVVKKLMVEKLRQCLELLDDKERELIFELFFNGKSERELSAEIGVPQKTINDRKNRIIAKLKKLMEN